MALHIENPLLTAEPIPSWSWTHEVIKPGHFKEKISAIYNAKTLSANFLTLQEEFSHIPLTQSYLLTEAIDCFSRGMDPWSMVEQCGINPAIYFNSRNRRGVLKSYKTYLNGGKGARSLAVLPSAIQAIGIATAYTQMPESVENLVQEVAGDLSETDLAFKPRRTHVKNLQQVASYMASKNRYNSIDALYLISLDPTARDIAQSGYYNRWNPLVQRSMVREARRIFFAAAHGIETPSEYASFEDSGCTVASVLEAIQPNVSEEQRFMLSVANTTDAKDSAWVNARLNERRVTGVIASDELINLIKNARHDYLTSPYYSDPTIMKVLTFWILEKIHADPTCSARDYYKEIMSIHYDEGLQWDIDQLEHINFPFLINIFHEIGFDLEELLHANDPIKSAKRFDKRIGDNLTLYQEKAKMIMKKTEIPDQVESIEYSLLRSLGLLEKKRKKVDSN